MPIRYIGKPNKYTGKTIFEILCNLKNFGVGRMVARNSFSSTYPEPTFFIIRKVEPQMDQENKFGSVWADVVFRGKNRGLCPLSDCFLPDHRLIPKEEEDTFARWNEVQDVTYKVLPRYRPVPPLMAMIINQQRKLKGDPPIENIQIESVYNKHEYSYYRSAKEGETCDVQFGKVKLSPQFLDGVKEI